MPADIYIVFARHIAGRRRASHFVQHLLAGLADRHVDEAGRVLHPLKMLVTKQRDAGVGAEYLVDRVAVEETAIEDRDSGLFERRDFAVDVRHSLHGFSLVPVPRLDYDWIVM